MALIVVRNGALCAPAHTLIYQLSGRQCHDSVRFLHSPHQLPEMFTDGGAARRAVCPRDMRTSSNVASYVQVLLMSLGYTSYM